LDAEDKTGFPDFIDVMLGNRMMLINRDAKAMTKAFFPFMTLC